MKHLVRKEAGILRWSKRIEEMRGVKRIGRMDRVVKTTFGTVEDEMIDTVEEKNPDEVEVDKPHQSRKRKCRENETFLAAKQLCCSKASIEAEKTRKVTVKDLAAIVLEKIFSYLDWNDLEAALLVCHWWKEIGSHPSLWTMFPLHLNVKRLSKVTKVPRLAWVKSVTFSLHFKNS